METDGVGETPVFWARLADTSSLSWDGVLVFFWSSWQEDSEGVLTAPVGFYTKCLCTNAKPAKGYKAETDPDPPGSTLRKCANESTQMACANGGGGGGFASLFYGVLEPL